MTGSMMVWVEMGKQGVQVNCQLVMGGGRSEKNNPSRSVYVTKGEEYDDESSSAASWR